MKTNIVYLFAALFAVTLISCTDESEQLFPAEVEEMNDSVLIHSNPLLDEVRSLRPSTSQQMDDGTAQPDRKGEKGRDHREWFHDWTNERLKNLDTGYTLSLGELYAIDPDGVNPYVFKFYFPDELMEEAKKYEGMCVKVMLYSSSGAFIRDRIYYSQNFSLDDFFTTPRYYVSDCYCFKYYFFQSYSSSSLFIRETQVKDMVIIKEWR